VERRDEAQIEGETGIVRYQEEEKWLFQASSNMVSRDVRANRCEATAIYSILMAGNHEFPEFVSYKHKILDSEAAP
jgi:hypothetical protein